MWTVQINDTNGAKRLYISTYKMLSKIYNFSLICFYDTFTICISCSMCYLIVFVTKIFFDKRIHINKFIDKIVSISKHIDFKR